MTTADELFTQLEKAELIGFEKEDDERTKTANPCEHVTGETAKENALKDCSLVRKYSIV